MESVLSLVLDVTERHRADQAFKALVSSTASAVGEAFFPVFVRELASVFHGFTVVRVNGGQEGPLIYGRLSGESPRCPSTAGRTACALFSLGAASN